MKSLAALICIPLILSMSAASAANKGDKAVSGELGFFSSSLGTVSDSDRAMTSNLSGLFGIGGDFDYFLDSDISVAGIGRYYTTTDSIAHTDVTNTLFSLGGVIRAYLIDTNHWSFVVSSGLGLVGATVKQSPPSPAASTSADSGTGLGLYWGTGIQYKLNSTVRLGVENLRILGLGEHLNGWVLSDYMAKATFFF